MPVQHFRMLYPDCVFRAVINSRNVAPPEDPWAEGSLCIDNYGVVHMINRKLGEDRYYMTEIELDTLGMDSFFCDGEKHDIFEGDIIEITAFSPAENAPEAKPAENDADLNDYSGFLEMSFGTETEEEKLPEREVFSEVPEGAEILYKVSGAVFMSGGMFYLQYFDETCSCLNAQPLYPYFFYDMLPAPNTAVKVIGNLYDNEDVFEEVLRLNNEQSSAPSM